MDLAAARPVPIPVYAEMGSVNPLFILPDALNSTSQTIAEGLVNSFTMGCGQFCTKPGLVFVVGSQEKFLKFTEPLIQAAANVPPNEMLTDSILTNFKRGIQELHDSDVTVAFSNTGTEKKAGPVISYISFTEFKKNSEWCQKELFGPATLLIHCEKVSDLDNIHHILHGQLTATFHGTEKDLSQSNVVNIIENVSTRVGRILWGGFPTGVEVNHSMHHGGPFPATSDLRTTSVGARAILRWVRPLCYQGFPESLLPPELQQQNPLNITRTVDGNLVPAQK